MKRTVLVLVSVVVLSLIIPFTVASNTITESGESADIALQDLRIPFIQNQGQFPEEVAFYAQTFGGTVFITTDGITVLTIPVTDDKGNNQAIVREEVLGASQVFPRGIDKSVTRVSNIIGSDPAKWQKGIPTYSTVSLGDVYEGIELHLRVYGDSVEKVFTARPGADPSSIRIKAQGITGLSVMEDRRLSMQTTLGEVTYSAPVAFQETETGPEYIQVAYAIQGDTYGFELGPYDIKQPLFIDPILQATYLGGNLNDDGYSMVLDDSSHVYVAGVTYSSNFPGIDGTSAQDTLYGTTDVFLAHLDPTLSILYQATYLGGTNFDYPGLGNGEGPTIAVHPINDNIYLTGYTLSSNFPNVSAGAQSTKVGGSADAFVAVLDPDLQNILAATYFGGSSMDLGTAMAIDPLNGDVYITGRTQSSPLPGTAGGFDSTMSGSWDGFAALLSPDLDVLRQATYIGGGDDDWPFSIMTPSDSEHPGYGSVYVTGQTYSASFPATAGGVQTSLAGYSDAFLIELSSSLTAGQSTYIGGTGSETGFRVKVHPDTDDLYVCGSTSSPDFPGVSGGAQAAHAGTGYSDAFVASLASHMGTLLQSTYFGGSASENNCDLYIDPVSGNIYLAGTTFSGDIPGTSSGAQPANAGDDDVFAARLSEDLTTLHQATYVGGSSRDMSFAIDANSNGVYITGLTWSGDFPGMSDTFSVQPTHGGIHYMNGKDAFVVRLDSTLAASFDPEIDVGPLTVDFGTIAVGDTLSAPVFIHNDGAGALTIDLIQIEDGTNFTGDIARDYMAVSACSTYAVSSTEIVLPGGGDCAVHIIFQPTAEASYADTLTIGSSDPDEEYVDVLLQGVGGSGPDISLSPTYHDFGSLVVGQADSKIFTISNLGDVLLVVDAVSLTDSVNFSVDLNYAADATDCIYYTSSTGIFELAASEYCLFRVEFSPVDHGILDESLEVVSNDPNHSSVYATLTGGSDIGLVPESGDFGNVDLDTVSALAFTLTNHGSMAYTVTTIAISDNPVGGGFDVVTGETGLCAAPPFQLAGGAECSFIIEFEPTDEDSFSTSVEIEIDPGSYMIEGDLEGYGRDSDGAGSGCSCSLAGPPTVAGIGSEALMILVVYGLWTWRRKRRT